ncbi:MULTISPECIES: type II toxin-antitoxin system RelE/ParE family toxin [Pseudomonas]|uniref:Type II toxin-antitoxin system RelE/ParE family toxin n=2 Tax=Pseudomonas chlororaphis TaxID=587753 RepID=A0AAP9VVM7_9PSED|nr:MULTISPECIES: type II toxin-antitoxin system RelE/ParE family toxin [Pseudomonas]AIC17556.1 plasmid stabilization protein [Pseudomonas chlororaphis]AUG38675.1 type II toxin-antitoxin system RelE/ParE family toxin [Pseudomonas chlororaphis]AZD89849.1 Death on curing protein, Doc toxin [Pseudomonas chlororaphis subsp. aureofaciens]AZD96300.1 Death on curing protein, Doc toxin [Pseudomonas chlororaphis subsp. aureofaciens]AZE02594.1 Death on curing protein, Doc toxin [Pseudomonas chlororaphis 
MTFKVVLLHSAETDLIELRTYLTQRFSTATWQSSYGNLKQAIRQLATLPYAGVIPEELEQLHIGHYRQILSGMNRIIYEVRDATVYIHVIADTRRDLQSLLMARLLRAKR